MTRKQNRERIRNEKEIWMRTGEKKRTGWKELLALQAVVIVYTMSGVFAKLAAGEQGLLFFVYYGADIAVLGVYALLWQQMIKRFELSVAYANRSVALLWSLLWSVLLFQEPVTGKKIAGVLLVLLGAVIINDGQGGKEDV